MKIGVAIPCYVGHIDKLYELLDSIETQTRTPDKVVVSSSSTDKLELPKKYKFEIEVFLTSGKLNASQNRNIAISHLQEMDFITVFDADDIMHPQRIETLCYVFEKYDADVILHNFLFENNFQEFTDVNVRINLLKQCHSGCIIHCDNAYNYVEHIHHSQISFKRYIFDKVKYPEESIYNRREDCIFCHRVFGLDNIKNAYVVNPLSYYRPSNTIF
jgi:hypothetical protein